MPRKIAITSPSFAQQFHKNFPDLAKAESNEEGILKEFKVVAMVTKEYSKDFVEEHL